MTEEEALARLDAIREMTEDNEYGIIGDNEEAHVQEDGLHQDVLTAIATGNVADPAKLAAIALRTRELPFTRWYA